ncbi:hypothetical protein [Spirillospora albida]|uniref:hypothetical protein n=1 Tax=Spirillospora albida TaxID=58123 RepID=UPI0004BE8AFA|nr:hypothetical protein [Spirillospora albida]
MTPEETEDKEELESRVHRCLRDRRLAPYVARSLVFPDEVADAVRTRGVFDSAKELDSYGRYTDSRTLTEDARREVRGLWDERVINVRTVTIALLVVATAVMLIEGIVFSPQEDDDVAYSLALVPAALFTIIGGGLLWAAAAGRISRLHLLSGVLLTAVGAVPLLTPVERLLGWDSQPAQAPVVFIASFVAGLGLGRPETIRQFVDARDVLNRLIDAPWTERTWTDLRRAWLRDAEEKVLMPVVTLVVNDFLGEDSDKLLVEQDSEGLKRLHDLGLAIPTRSEKRVLGTMDRVDGGSIAIAGPRGAGKSTLLRVICGGRDTDASETGLTVYASAPAEYVPRDFLIELFQRVCETYITEQGHSVDRSAAQRYVLRKRTAWVIRDGLWTLSRFALSLALLALAAWTLRDGVAGLIEPVRQEISADLDEFGREVEDVWNDYRWAFQLALVAAAALVWPRPRVWRALRWHIEPSLVTRAREHLLRLQVERTTTWGLTANLPGVRGVTMGLTKGGSLKYLPWSYPELVGNFRDFMTAIAREAGQGGGRVVVAIDEVDRIGSVEKAERFISEIKAVFGIQNCFYIVSVAEDVGSVFARRAVIGRSVFENAFDDVVVIEPLLLTESRDLLLRRVPGFTDSFAFLVHSLSGGVPRELLRVTRRLVEINLEESRNTWPHPQLADLAAALVKEEMTETLTGTRTQLPPTPEGVDLGDIFDSMRGLLGIMRSTEPSNMIPALPHLEEFARLDVAPLPPEMPELAPVRATLVQLSAFALFCLTVVEVFDENVFTFERAAEWSFGSFHAPFPGSFEELAAARRELSVSPSSCRAALTRFRAAWDLPPL